MKNILASLLALFYVSQAMAQLPANPWSPNQLPNPNDGQFGNNLPQQALPNVPNAPIYENGATGGDILPVDPWARARDRSGIQTWRGSGQHGNLNYIGEATTYGTAMGQEMIAPEVNRHNMVVFVDHLRSLGYKIPESYNSGIKDMPSRYGKKLQSSYTEIMSAGVAGTPVEGISAALIKSFDNYTGLDSENLLMNSVKILGTD